MCSLFWNSNTYISNSMNPDVMGSIQNQHGIAVKSLRSNILLKDCSMTLPAGPAAFCMFFMESNRANHEFWNSVWRVHIEKLKALVSLIHGCRRVTCISHTT